MKIIDLVLVNESYIYIPDESMICDNIVNC